MKRYIKLIAILLVMGIFVGCAGGCKPYIKNDDNPDDFVTFSKDKSTLDYEGKTYYKVPNDSELFFIKKTSNKYDQLLHVYQDGKPEFVSNIFNATAFYNKSQDAFKIEMWDISKTFLDSSTYDPPEEYYFNSTTYSAYLDHMEAGAPLDRIGFEYLHSPENSMEYTFELGVLSKKASQEILDCIYNASEWDSMIYDELQKRIVSSVLYGMYNCDKKGIFAKRLDEYDIYKTYTTNAYLINKKDGTAIKLSAETSKEIKLTYLHTQISNQNTN